MADTLERRPELKETEIEFVERPYTRPAPRRSLRQSVLSPLSILFIFIILMVSLVSYGIGA